MGAAAPKPREGIFMRRIIASSILTIAVFWLALPFGGVARADELPPAACGGKLDLNQLGPAIIQEIQDSDLIGSHSE